MCILCRTCDITAQNGLRNGPTKGFFAADRSSVSTVHCLRTPESLTHRVHMDPVLSLAATTGPVGIGLEAGNLRGRVRAHMTDDSCDFGKGA